MKETHMLGNFKSLAIAGIVVAMLGLGGCANKPMKTVYHVNDSADAVGAMRNAGNQLEADPTGKIVFVTHSKGIDFLVDGARDKDGNPYNIAVEKLMAKGVQFDVCNNTMVKRKIDPKTMLPGIVVVPSGVAEISKLQAREGYVYLKP